MTGWNRPTNPKWDPKKPVAPFSPDGDMQHYPEGSGHGVNRVGPEWREVQPFEATLVFAGYRRGRSAAYFLWENANGDCFPMMLSDLSDLLLTRTIDGGEVSGTWRLVKRGQNYGIAAVNQ